MTEKHQPHFPRTFVKPMADLMVVNAEATGAMLLRMNALSAELIREGIDHARALAGAADFAEAGRLQTESVRKVAEKVGEASRENADAAREAFSKAGEVIRGMFSQSRAA